MIPVLSSPYGQVGFTNIEGRQPYLHKYVTPISRIEYCSSVANLPTNGFDVSWATMDSEVNVDTTFSGVDHIVKFYSGQGVPPQLLDYKAGLDWRVSYTGSFTPPVQDWYYLYFAGDGEVTYSGNFGTETFSLSIDSQDYVTSAPLPVVPALDNAITIVYTPNRNSQDAGFICLWKNLGITEDEIPEPIVLDSHTFLQFRNNKIDNPSFSNLSMYNKTKYIEKEDGTSQFSFEVPLISSTNSYSYKGYWYQSSTDAYIEKDSGQELKKYRMIRYSEGYRVDGDDELIVKFTGQIRDFKINYKKEGNDTLKITCNDFSIFTKDTLNLQDPTPIDYWQAGYMTNSPGRANGVIKPRTFDGWELHKVYQVLLTNSGILPSSFYKTKLLADYSGSSATGGYLIESTLDDSLDVPILPINSNYGVPTIGEVENIREDDTYSFKMSTGEFYKDFIDKITRSWYYKWGFDPYGYPLLARINVPSNVYNDRILNVDEEWTEDRNVNALKGTYIKTTEAGAIASVDAVGSKFSLLVGTGPDCYDGSSPSTFMYTIRHEDTFISSASYKALSDIDHFYYNGALPNTGENSSYISIADGLPYDTYRIVVEAYGGAGNETRIEGILAYEEDYTVPVETYYVADSATGFGNISKLNVKIDIDSHRNDCVVLGRRTGTIFKITSDGEEQTVNRNNPTYTYIQSSSRDLKSIHSSTASNYVGRSRRTVIVDPSINSQEQADYISFGVVSEYGTPHKRIDFTLPGNPKLQVGDCIAVSDNYKNAVTENDYAWITNIDNSTDKTYTTKIQTSPTKPVDSYWQRPRIDISEYDGHYVWNMNITNAGYISKLAVSFDSSLAGSGYDADANIYIERYLTTTVMAQAIPKNGYMRVGPEIIKYASADVHGFSPTYGEPVVRLKGITRDIPNGSYKRLREYYHNFGPSGSSDIIRYAVNHLSSGHSGGTYPGDDVIIGHLPQSVSSWAPTIEFDLLADANVDVGIFNLSAGGSFTSIQEVSEVLVDSLSNIDSDLTGNNTKFLRAGHHAFSWGGFDRSGEYNNSVKEKEEPSLLGTHFYARENYQAYYALYHGGSNPFDDLGGWQEAEFSTGFGMFTGRLRIHPNFTTDPFYYQADSQESYCFSVGTMPHDNVGTIKQILVTPGVVDLKFSTSGLFYADANVNGSQRWIRPDRKTGPFADGELTQATNYPTTQVNGEIAPVFFTNTSNLETYGASRGLLFSIVDYEKANDNDIDRKYIPTMPFQFVQLGWYQSEEHNLSGLFTGTLRYFDPIITTGVFNEDGDIDFFSSGKMLQFPIKSWMAKKKISFIPDEWVATFKDIERPVHDYFIMGIQNYLIFGEGVVDFSGRRPLQVRYYDELINPRNEPMIHDFGLTSHEYVIDNVTVPRIAYENLRENYPEDLPFDFSVRYDTALNASTATNRGMYEFIDASKIARWTYKYIGRAGGNAITKKISFNKLVGQENMLTMGSYLTGYPIRTQRNNYISWVDHDYVRSIFYHKVNTQQYEHTLEYYGDNFPNVLVPEMVNLYLRSDFA